jgi:hypothetical protein
MSYDLSLLHVMRLMMRKQEGPSLPSEHGLAIKTYLWERVGRRAHRINGLRMPTDLDELLEIRRLVKNFQTAEPRMKAALAWLDLTSATLLRPELEALLRSLPGESRPRLYAVRPRMDALEPPMDDAS